MTRTRLLTAAAVMGVAVQAALARRTARPGGILEHRYLLLLEIAVWAVVSALTVLAVLRLPRRTAVALLLVGAVVVRLASFSAKAPLSDDLYRYAWDGVVQSEGISPYRYVPEAQELAYLRDVPGMDWIWPPPERREPSETRINRANVRTIYPPVAEGWFWLVHQVVPLEAEDPGYEGAGMLLDLAVLGALLALLRSRGDPRWAAVYALTPLPVLEAVQNAHVDVLGVLLVLGAVALERRGRTLPAAAVLALAALVKVYPALLFPLLMRRRPVAVVAVAAAVAVLSYLPHVLAVGARVVGYLPGYLSEEEYGSGSRYLLLPFQGPAATVVVALGVLALVAWALRTDLPFAGAGARLLAGVFLLVTPVQPWYALLLVALVALSGWWAGLAVAAAAYPLFFATILDGSGELVGRLSYGAALLVAVIGWRRAGTAAPRAPLPARP